ATARSVMSAPRPVILWTNQPRRAGLATACRHRLGYWAISSVNFVSWSIGVVLGRLWEDGWCGLMWPHAATSPQVSQIFQGFARAMWPHVGMRQEISNPQVESCRGRQLNQSLNSQHRKHVATMLHQIITSIFNGCHGLPAAPRDMNATWRVLKESPGHA